MTDFPHEILIVDDDAGLRETLVDFLEMEGFATRQAADIGDARQCLVEREPDLILLDVNIPGGGGLAFASEIRSGSQTPIVMISGKGAMVDRVVGLEIGADDYLAKPFELRELLARIRAVLRRVKPRDTYTDHSVTTRMAKFGGRLILDPARRSVVTTGGQPIELTGAEFNLLGELVERPNRVLTRDVIADLLHNGEINGYDRSIDTLVSRLRKKLDEHVDASKLIQTVRGEGYVLASVVEWVGG